MPLHPLLIVVVFLAAAGIAFVVLRQWLPRPMDERLQALHDKPAPRTHRQLDWLSRWLKPLAQPSLPEGGWEHSPLRVRFYNAGIRVPAAPVIYFGAKTLLTFALPAVLFPYLWFSGLEGAGTDLMVVVFLLAACGYYLPNVVLAQWVKRRQRELFEAFPDALDLMRVCVEAGLGLDASIERVGREMALESPALAEEFHLLSLQLRAGASRAEGLKDLALRVALEDIDAMVGMLVQADRFGTSISESLRVHAESLRTRRRQMAEEKAARLPVALLFPLIFCIFPALLVVLLGPAVIALIRILVPTMSG